MPQQQKDPEEDSVFEILAMDFLLKVILLSSVPQEDQQAAAELQTHQQTA